MADERIDIEVTDKVARSIKAELAAIAQAARDGHGSISQMKRELSALSVAANQSSASVRQAAQAQAAMSAAEAKGSAAAAKAALAEQKLATERERTRAATLRAEAVELRTARTRVNANAAADTTARITKELGDKTKLTTNELTNLGYQLNDIFVSLASGQKPMTVFIQQGTQIGQIAGASGVGIKGMISSVVGLTIRFAPLAIAAAGAITFIGLLTREANKSVGDLKKYAESLGLTSKEIKRLEDTTVTTSDVIKAVWQTSLERISDLFGINTKEITQTWNNFLDFLWSAAKGTAAGIYATFTGMFYATVEIAKKAAKGDFSPIEGTIEGYKKAYSDAIKFIDDVEKQSAKNAKARTKGQADAIIADRTPRTAKADNTAENRAAAMAKVNLQLDNELQRMKLILPERERAQRFDQIEEQLAGRKIKLSKEEAEAIKEKIKAIQDYSAVQAESDRIYSETIAQEIKYHAALEAIIKARDDGTISAKEAERRKNIEIEQYKDIRDPLRQYSLQLQQQKDLLFLYGSAADDAARAQQLFNDAIRNGTVSSDTSKWQDFMPQAQKENKDARISSAIGNSISDYNDNQTVINDYADRVAKIKELYADEQISHQQMLIAKQQADEEYVRARLSNEMTMFDALAGLQNSGVKELAAIGKAAAIAQATIDGVLAVQKALATLPPPISYVAAAAIGVTAATNVAKIAGIGFEQGGYTGNMGTKEVAGVVHGREFVFDAKSTARLGVPTLEAIRSGRLTQPVAANNNSGPAQVRVVQNPGTVVEQRVVNGITEIEVKRMIYDHAPRAAADNMKSSPNSHMSKALQQSYGVPRNR